MTKKSHLRSVQHHTDEAETKRERFERIGKNRMQRALTAIRLIGNLSVAGTYSFTDQDIEQMTEVLRIAIDRSLARFRKAKPVDADQFFFSSEAKD